jgi:DNA-binding XRE family transcriptional regulator
MEHVVEREHSEVSRLNYDLVKLVTTVLIDRIRRLPAGDQNDLFELFQEIPKAETDEERESISRAVREILAQDTMAVHAVDLSSEPEPGPKLHRWIEFVSGRIRAARERTGLTQAELSDRSGLPQSHISRIENGKLSPSHATLEKIAKGLGLPVSEFDPSA